MRMSPPLDLARPPTPPPPLESSETPENLTQEREGKREVVRTGEEVGNDLSVLTQETPDVNRVSAQVFMQPPFSLTPGLYVCGPLRKPLVNTVCVGKSV